MADEQVMTGSAGPAKRQRRSRTAAAAAGQEIGPDLDQRERNISLRRKAMGPQPPSAGANTASAGVAAPAGPPDEPPTDPK